MKLSSLLPTTLLFPCLLASGCFSAAAPEDADVPFDSFADVPYEALDCPISTNGLLPEDFWDPKNQEALRNLGKSALLDASGRMVATPLLATPGGRSVLSYAILCALAASTTVQSAAGDTFSGEDALAPAWTTRALNTPEQRWVTACMADHVNGVGEHVSILMKGNHPALTPGPGVDTSAYTIPDMTAFGNLFGEDQKVYACVDLGIQLACGVNVSLYTVSRLCGGLPLCGAVFTGLCLLSCSVDAAGNPTCTAPLGATYAESISTKLQKTDVLDLYPLCLF